MDVMLDNIGYGREIPPDNQQVIIWFIQKGGSEETALAFIGFYESRGWRNLRGCLIKDWKVRAWDWLWNRL